jgi:hypothetical protein
MIFEDQEIFYFLLYGLGFGLVLGVVFRLLGMVFFKK